MHRIRLIASAVALLALASFAVADSPRRGAGDLSPAVCPPNGQACPSGCGPCPEPCPLPCVVGQTASVGAEGTAHSAR
jgi:hypothetical protein